MAQDIDAAIVKAAGQAAVEQGVPLTPEEEAALGPVIPPHAGQISLDPEPVLDVQQRQVPMGMADLVEVDLTDAEPGDTVPVRIPVEHLRRYARAVEEVRQAQDEIARWVLDHLR